MTWRLWILVAALAAGELDAEPTRAQAKKCPPDAVKVGPACIDRWEASVWRIPVGEKALLKKLQSGKVTLEKLAQAGAVQLGCTTPPWNDEAYPIHFPESGNWLPLSESDPPSPGVYAVSIPGVLPTTCTSWFQAEQACALSGKRLLTNQEWQRAVAGTPDPGAADDDATQCEVSNDGAPDPAPTGSRSQCTSRWGVSDMVGNAMEWVADWLPRADGTTTWLATMAITDGDSSAFGNDGADDNDRIPGA